MNFTPEDYIGEDGDEESLDDMWEQGPTLEHAHQQNPWGLPVHHSVLGGHSEHPGDAAPQATGTTTQEVRDTLDGFQTALAQGFTEQGMLQGRVSDLSNSFMLAFDEVKGEVDQLKEWAINTTGDTQRALGEIQQGMVSRHQG